MSAVYVSYFPDVAAPGAPDAVGSLAEVALGSGVRRLVLLSGRGEDEAQSEKRLIDSGADWTSCGRVGLGQNVDEGYLLEPVLAGEVACRPGAWASRSPTPRTSRCRLDHIDTALSRTLNETTGRGRHR